MKSLAVFAPIHRSPGRFLAPVCRPVGALLVGAAFALWALGCSGDDGGIKTLIDAGAGATDAADTEQVTVNVTAAGQPASGITVIFHDTDGQPLSTVLSGGGGIAVGQLPNGGFVTLVPSGSGGLATFSDVRSNDTLFFDVSPRGSPLGSVDITLPTPPADAANVLVATGCGADSVAVAKNSLSLPLDSRCLGDDGEMSVVAIAFNPIGPVVHGVASIRDVPVLNGSATVIMPGYVDNFSNFALDIVNVAGGSRIVGGMGEVVEGVIFNRTFVTDINPFVFPVASSIADTLHWNLLYGLAPTPTPNGLFVTTAVDFQRLAPTAAGASYNGAVPLLPPVASIALDLSNRAQPVVSYTSAASIDMWVAGIVVPGGRNWSMISTPEATSVTFPILPPGVADEWVTTEGSQLDATAIILEISEIEGFEPLRTGLGFTTFTAPAPPLGGPGSFVYASVGALDPDNSSAPPVLRTHSQTTKLSAETLVNRLPASVGWLR